MTTPQPPVVCYVCSDLEPSGTAHHLLELCRYLDREERALRVVSLSPRGAVADELEGLNVPVYPLDIEEPDGRGRTWAAVMGFVNLFQLLRDMRPEVVHTLDHRSHVLARVAARFAGVPWVLASMRSPARRGGLSRLIGRMTQSFVDAVVAPTEAMVREAVDGSGVHPARIRQVLDGINLARVAGHRPASDLGSGRPVVACLAGLDRDAGTEDVIDAASILLRYHEDLRVVIAGVGPGDPVPYVRRTQRLEIHERVSLPGVRTDVGAVLAAADVCVVPPRRAGAPLALFEALASGKPVVATRVPGITDVLEADVHALLVDPDRPALLADAIDRVLMDRELAARLAAAGKALVHERHLARDMAAAHGRLYDRLA